MLYYSTNKQAAKATLQEAVVKGLASDKGLYMPEIIKQLPDSFFENIQHLSFQEMSYIVAGAFFGEDVEPEALKKIVYETLNFDVPLVQVSDNIYSLELFHGPTLAFKDVGARFMSRLLGYFIKKQGQKDVPLMFTRHCIKQSLGWCPKEGTEKHPYKEPFFLVYNSTKLRLSFDCKNCEMKVFNQTDEK